MELKELTTKTIAELEAVLHTTREELHDIRMKTASNQFKNVRQIRQLRRLIARVQTLMRAKRSA